MANKKGKSPDNIDAMDEFDTFTFAEGDEAIIPVGKCIAEFNFDNILTSSNNDDLNSNHFCIDEASIPRSLDDVDLNLTVNKSLINNLNIPSCHGSIPSIDNETPNVKRCYVLRASTVKKINEIKNNHSSLNVCVSTIVDLAVANYYEYLHKLNK